MCVLQLTRRRCRRSQLRRQTSAPRPLRARHPVHLGDNSDNEDGFRVYRWSVPDGGKQWVVATTTAPDVTTFLDTGLQLSAEYFYFACSYNAAGETCATGAPGWLGATTTDGLPDGAEVGDRLTRQCLGAGLVERTDE